METRNYQDNAQLDLRIIHFSCAFFLFTQNFVLVRIIAQMPDRDHGLLITVLLCGFQVCRRVGRARRQRPTRSRESVLAVSPAGDGALARAALWSCVVKTQTKEELQDLYLVHTAQQARRLAGERAQDRKWRGHKTTAVAVGMSSNQFHHLMRYL
jgi:hypothetical protein